MDLAAWEGLFVRFRGMGMISFGREVPYFVDSAGLLKMIESTSVIREILGISEEEEGQGSS